MKEHGRIFTGDNVRAILDGRKSQTRRIVTPQNSLIDGHGASAKTWLNMRLDLDQAWVDNGPSPGGWPGPYLKVPAGDDAVHRLYSRIQPGDRIWVRETTIRVEEHGYVGPVYAESEYGRELLCWGLSPGPDDPSEVEPYDLRLRPSIFMRRAMARILLDVTAVRVERLQDISESDAEAEGAETKPDQWDACYTDAFSKLWDAINGPGSWDTNPLVWAYSFQRIDDQQEATS